MSPISQLAAEFNLSPRTVRIYADGLGRRVGWQGGKIFTQLELKILHQRLTNRNRVGFNGKNSKRRVPPTTSIPELLAVFNQLDRMGLSINEVASRTRTHPNTIYSWRHGLTEPRIQDFFQLARLAGLPVTLGPAPIVPSTEV